jgi:hypothetical protein
MRRHAVLWLSAGLMGACGDEPLNPTGEGTLLLSTEVTGDDRDLDGFQLTVDGTPVLTLDPIVSQRLTLAAGSYTLGLVGLDSHCTVGPATPLTVEVVAEADTEVAFAVDCPATGVVVGMTTNGLDPDPNGYGLTVDGVERGRVRVNGASRVARLEPGDRTMGLSDVAANCRVDGPGTRSVSVVSTELVPVEFAVVCTATSGVIRVVVDHSGSPPDGEYGVALDGGPLQGFDHTGPYHISGVSGGEHVLALDLPANCSSAVDQAVASVSVGAGVRDTVEIVFPTGCEPGTGTLRVSTRTTGSFPPFDPYYGSPLRVLLLSDYSWYYPSTTDLGGILPNGLLGADVPSGDYQLYISNVPGTCLVVPATTGVFTLRTVDTLHFEFRITCPP